MTKKVTYGLKRRGLETGRLIPRQPSTLPLLGLRRGGTFNSKGKKEGLLLSRETPDFTLSGSLLLDFLG
jgi:hypothetical protein